MKKRKRNDGLMIRLEYRKRLAIDCMWQGREKIGSMMTMCLSHCFSSRASKAIDLGEFEGETDWELEVEVAEAGRNNLISEKLNLKYWENFSCRDLNIEARTTEKKSGLEI